MKNKDINYLRAYWRYLRQYRALLVFGFVLIPCISVFQLLQPLLLKQGIDVDIATRDLNGLYLTALFYGICVLAELVCRSLQSYLFQRIGIKSVTNIRDDLFKHLLNQSSTFFDKTPVGRLVTRVTSDIEALNETFSSGVVTLIADLVTLAGILGIMFYLSPQLTLITLLVVPPLIFTVNFFRSKLRFWYRHIRTIVSNLHSYLQEQLEGYSIVQLFLRERRNFAGYSANNAEYRKANAYSIVYDALLYAVVDAMASIVIALMIWYGFREVLTGTLSLGLLVAFIEYVRKFFMPLKELASKFAILQASLAALEKIFDSFSIDESIPSGSTLPRNPQGLICFKNVGFAYPGFEDKPVLDNVSFTIAPGEVVALVGPTGSGKSTITKLLSHLYTGYSGSITFDGVEIKELDITGLRKLIGVVHQDVTLFSRSVLFNLTLGDENVSDTDVMTTAKLVNADTFIESMPNGYRELLFNRGANISAGQAQLLSFARALAAKSPVVVMDEATSAVDSLSEKMIQTAIKQILESKTVLIVAHRLSTIKKATKILAINHGRVVESGTHDELLKRGGFYAKLFQMQFTHL